MPPPPLLPLQKDDDSIRNYGLNRWWGGGLLLLWISVLIVTVVVTPVSGGPGRAWGLQGGCLQRTLLRLHAPAVAPAVAFVPWPGSSVSCVPPSLAPTPASPQLLNPAPQPLQWWEVFFRTGSIIYGGGQVGTCTACIVGCMLRNHCRPQAC
jgi:hypothetical protein